MGWQYNRRNKYGARKVTKNGLIYDSKKEARRAAFLETLEKAGAITDLRRQVKFVLIPTQREPDTVGPRGGRKPGKVIERECSYIADFVYIDTKTGETVIEDTKGVRTKEYIIKRKLMLERFGIRIKEI